MKIELTPKQQRIYDFIALSIESQGFCPTMREIGKHCKISVGTVHDQTQALLAKGALKIRIKGSARAFSLALPRESGVPLVGRVGAGSGVIAQEDMETRLNLGDIAVKTDFLLRVKGDSMDAAGILEGDLVQVHQQQSADDGDIVVAVIGDEGVVKRFRNSSRTPRLESANKKYASITNEFTVVGKVVGLIRRYDSSVSMR